jgi:ribosomal protein L15
LSRRIPKLKGFSREYFKLKYPTFAINLSIIVKNFKEGEVISTKTLLEKRLVKSKTLKVKVITGKEDFSKKFIFDGIKFSSSAKAIVEKAGCTIK